MPAVPQPFGVVIVGCGAISETHAKAFASLPAETRLIGCVDLDAARASAFAARHGVRVYSWAEALGAPEVGIVSLCTPSGLHAEQACEALKAGKHVLIEKPMDITVEACDRLLSVQRDTGRCVSVISQHRFDPGSKAARAALLDGSLGRPVLVDARIPWYRTQEYYDSGDWRGTWALDGGGCLMNQGIHTVDLMLWLCGPVRRVQAAMRTAAHERIEVEDVVCATLEFESGAIGTLVATTAAYPGFPVRLAVHGTEGSVVLEGDELNLLALRGRETLSGPGASAHALQVAAGGTRAAVRESAGTTLADEGWAWGAAHRAQIQDFCAAIRTGGRPISDGEAGRAAVALIRAVYAAAGRS